MEPSVIITICVVVCTYIAVFCLGLFIGMFVTKGNSQADIGAPASFLKNQGKPQNKTNKIEIDDQKVVLNISTDGLEKKFDKIAEEKKTKNNISSSVNKLKSMKGK